jgi:potassium-transporting ATPase KdpC subunit
MLTEILKQMKIAVLLMLAISVLTGLIYPVVVTAVAQLLFPSRANGSLIFLDNKAVGSELIGQSFTDPKYFWGRPSATTPFPYNAEASSGSNYGPMNQDFLFSVKSQIIKWQQADIDDLNSIPVDLVTSSGSGLDPDISPLAAYYQAHRIAKARNLLDDDIKSLINKNIQKRQWGMLGEPRVNVLQLNLALDDLDNRSNHRRA